MTKIYYVPDNGSTKLEHCHHYYHYLLGYLLPVFEDVDLDADHTICLQSFVPMNYLAWGLGFKVVGHPREADEFKKVSGHDSWRFFLTGTKEKLELYAKINDKLDKHLGITVEDYTPTEPYILLVDRGTRADELHDNRAPSRRMVTNMDQVEECVMQYGNVKRCVLDKMPLRDQIILFRGATHVVAQHGGALTNLVFAKNCKGVVEVVDGDHPYHPNVFKRLFGQFEIPLHQLFVDGSDMLDQHKWRVNIEKLDEIMGKAMGQ